MGEILDQSICYYLIFDPNLYHSKVIGNIVDIETFSVALFGKMLMISRHYFGMLTTPMNVYHDSNTGYWFYEPDHSTAFNQQ